jgi:hypothetical protein
MPTSAINNPIGALCATVADAQVAEPPSPSAQSDPTTVTAERTAGDSARLSEGSARSSRSSLSAGASRCRCAQRFFARTVGWSSRRLLPAYARLLNLIKRLWRYLKDKVSCHQWWQDRDRRKQAMDTLLGAFEARFHPTDRAAFRPVQDICESAWHS